MAVLRIAKMGNPVLLKKAEPVADPTAPDIRRLAADMQETLEDIGASGLAAPQVFESKRIVVYRIIASRIPRCRGGWISPSPTRTSRAARCSTTRTAHGPRSSSTNATTSTASSSRCA